VRRNEPTGRASCASALPADAKDQNQACFRSATQVNGWMSPAGSCMRRAHSPRCRLTNGDSLASMLTEIPRLETGKLLTTSR
jgi:hypothetical protein